MRSDIQIGPSHEIARVDRKNRWDKFEIGDYHPVTGRAKRSRAIRGTVGEYRGDNRPDARDDCSTLRHVVHLSPLTIIDA